MDKQAMVSIGIGDFASESVINLLFGSRFAWSG